jgi:phosphatidylserine/phosphatidylglycerophosphate/cardiolipin synthase-like enzyme
VVVANLDPLRDSNFLYSSAWRLTTRWWASRNESAASGNSSLGPDPATSDAAAALAQANLKADRRNLLIADDGRDGLTGIVSATEVSAAGAGDSNVAIQLAGPALVRLLKSEIAIARFSGWTGVLGAPAESDTSAAARPDPPQGDPEPRVQASGAPMVSPIDVRVLTEGAIRDALIDRINAVQAGDAIDVAAFNLSERAIIESLITASRRGAAVRLILDPGEDAFGRSGAGIANRSVAGELLAASDGAIRVRWYRTHGERFHTGLVLIRSPQRCWLAVGSANLTRRSLEDYDLVANAALALPTDSALGHQAAEYFETLWSNRAALGIEYTADVGVYADASQLDYWRYRLMEATGLSLF